MRRGPLYMVVASLLFTIMVGAAKVARQELGAFEVMCWRSVASLPLAFIIARGGGLAIRNRKAMAVRGLLGFAAMTCFFTAAKGLALADLSIINKLQPIVIAIAAPFVLGAGERSGPLVWLVLALGLGGSALIIGPDLQVGNWYGLWALGACFFSAGAHMAVRHLGQTENALAIVFWFQAITLTLSLVGHGVTEGQVLPVPPTHLWPYLATVGVAATAGQVFMTKAYAMEQASVVAAASYAAPIWAVLGDLVVFGLPPTAYVLVGGALVVGAGLVLILGPAPTPATGDARPDAE